MVGSNGRLRLPTLTRWVTRLFELAFRPRRWPRPRRTVRAAQNLRPELIIFLLLGLGSARHCGGPLTTQKRPRRPQNAEPAGRFTFALSTNSTFERDYAYST